MGIFRANYAKEGKGVTKEQAEKRSYFGTLVDKFFDMVKINLLYFACNLPMLIICVILALSFWSTSNVGLYIEQLKLGNIVMVLWLMLPLVPFILSGPFTAGLTYIIRNFVKREHVFLVSDFFEHTKKNIKQSLIMNVILFAGFLLYASAFIFYFLTTKSILIMAIILVLGIMLISMTFYTYPMIVSFDMKIKDIIKNSWIFAMAKLPQNLFYIIILLAVHIASVGTYGMTAAGVWAILMPLFLISWSSFTMTYYAWRVIEKHMMPEEKKEEEAVFSDESL